MVFSSAIFLFLFLPAVLGGHSLLRSIRLKNALLLLASLFFYAWGEQLFAVAMLGSIAFNWAAGALLSRLRNPRARRGTVAAAVVCNLALLGALKYANFLVDNVNVLLTRLSLTPMEIDAIRLPIGISFFTFQAMSYVIDVYRRDTDAARNPLDVGLYIAMFPQLIAGPIVRYKEVAANIRNRRVELADFADGIRIFTIGLGKKMIFANSFAVHADGIFNARISELPTATAWLGAISLRPADLLRLLRLLGHGHRPRPHVRVSGSPRTSAIPTSPAPSPNSGSAGISRFPRGSATTCTSRWAAIGCSPRRTGVNLVTVFFLCGLWHGASWTFIVWGLFHGAFLVIERVGLRNRLARAPRGLAHVYALLIVIVGWVVFRAESLADAGAFLKVMAGFAETDGVRHGLAVYLTPHRAALLLAGILACTPVGATVTRALRRALAPKAGPGSPAWSAGAAVTELLGLGAILLLSAMLLARGTYNPFIYFRF